MLLGRTEAGEGDLVAAVVQPCRAGGAVLGFAVGLVAAWVRGADDVGAVLHGLLGALLVLPIGWCLGLVLARSMLRARADAEGRALRAGVDALERRAQDAGEQEAPAHSRSNA